MHLLLLLLFAAFCPSWTTAAPSLYSFGLASGDHVLPRGPDSDSGFLNLSVPFPFYGKSRRVITVNNRGLLLFETISPADYTYSLVLPFGAHVDTTSAGQVFYRASQDEAMLNNTAKQVNAAFDGQYLTFKPTLAFITTWFQVGYYNAHSIPNNTYQAVLLTNGTISFSIFIYPPGGIQWTTPDSNEGVKDAAIVGFVNNTGYPDLLPGSGRNTTRLLSATSNANMTGVWIFRIDKAIAGPKVNECASAYQQYCDQNAYCVDRELGFLCVCKPGYEGDGKTCTANEGSGADTNRGSCMAAGHTKCCYGSHCQAGDCYCDPLCYFVGDCCEDITTTCPLSRVDVLVNFQMSEIQVSEGTSVSVCVQSWTVKGQLQPVQVLVTTRDGSAKEDVDYGGKVLPLFLHGNSTTCVQTQVYDGSTIRDNRYFSFTLTSDSTLVRISTNTTIVWIADRSVGSVAFTQSTYTVERGQAVSLCAMLNATCKKPVTVTFSATPGTALNGVDYVEQSTDVVFPIGVRPVACVQYRTLVGNGSASDSKSFTVTLTSTDRAVQGPQHVTVTIVGAGSVIPTTQGASASPGDQSAITTTIIVGTTVGAGSFVIIVSIVIVTYVIVVQFRKYNSQRERTYSTNRKSLEVKNNYLLETDL